MAESVDDAGHIRGHLDHCVVLDCGRGGGAPVAAQVRGDGVIAGVSQCGELAAPGVPQFGEAVQQQDQRAVSGLGQVLALAAILGGMLAQEPWLILAGFFIMIGAQIEDQGVFFQSVVDTVRMREVMLTDFATLSPSDTLADALYRCVHSLQEDFPVVRGPQLVGIVSRQRILEALRNDGNGYVQSVMSRAFQVARPEDTLGTTIRRLTAGHGLALIPITESGKVVGIVSVQNLMSSMSLLAEQRRIERQEAEN